MIRISIGVVVFVAVFWVVSITLNNNPGHAYRYYQLNLEDGTRCIRMFDSDNYECDFKNSGK